MWDRHKDKIRSFVRLSFFFKCYNLDSREREKEPLFNDCFPLFFPPHLKDKKILFFFYLPKETYANPAVNLYATCCPLVPLISSRDLSSADHIKIYLGPDRPRLSFFKPKERRRRDKRNVLISRKIVIQTVSRKWIIARALCIEARG